MAKTSRYRYRYSLVNETGKVLFTTNDLWYAIGEADSKNLELRKRLPNIKVGKRKFENRYKILRKITHQIQIPFK